jgi:hypothetical protein
MKQLWWLSFIDEDRPVGDKFLGVCVVRANDMLAAVQKAWDLGINPGGEVAMAKIAKIPPDCINRLMQKNEIIERELLEVVE